MSLIKPRTRGKHMVRLVTRLARDNQETLHAYAQFICEPVEYVLNELIDTVLAKDKDFAKWRAEHPDSCVPAPTTRRGRQAGPISGVAIGTWGVQAYPVRLADDLFLQMIFVRKPAVSSGCRTATPRCGSQPPSSPPPYSCRSSPLSRLAGHRLSPSDSCCPTRLPNTVRTPMLVLST
jgi:hypothetical protein